MPVLPNFLVIGAGKGGTTSLHRWLAGHPQIFVPRLKETNYFAYEACQLMADVDSRAVGHRHFPIRSWDQYLDLFREADGFEARGEVSPAYLAWPSVPEQISRRLPDVRLIAVLRHPVDRAYSSYLMHARDGREPRTFVEAIRQELAGNADSSLSYGQLNYVRIGFYHQHLSRYRERFDPGRLHVELYDDLREDPRGMLRRIYGFLGVDEEHEPDLSIRLNPSGVPRSRALAPLLRKNRMTRVIAALAPRAIRPPLERVYDRWRARNLLKPPLDATLRSELNARYRDDIQSLGHELGRDLAGWLEG